MTKIPVEIAWAVIQKQAAKFDHSSLYSRQNVCHPIHSRAGGNLNPQQNYIWQENFEK